MKAFIFLSILALLCLCIECMQYKHHVELKAGVFDVYWTVNTSNPQTIYVKYVAKTTGWAALGWSKTPNGGGMIKYDIALGGVRNTNETYLKDYYSPTKGKPTYDGNALQHLTLTSATENGGFTTIEFSRQTDTGDTGNDVPIQNGTKTWLMWAINPVDATGPESFTIHTARGYTPVPYNMFSGKKFPQESTTAQPTSGSQAMKPSTTIRIILTLTAMVVFQLGSVLMLH